jgi:hypothetical protein
MTGPVRVIISHSKALYDKRLEQFVDYLKTIQKELGIEDPITVKNRLDFIDFSSLLVIDKNAYRVPNTNTEDGPNPFLKSSVELKAKLEGAGIKTIPFKVANSKTSAVDAAKKLEPPFRVYTPFEERFALHAEEIGLAYIQATDADTEGVVIEASSGGSVLSALVCIHPGGQYRVNWFETKWMSPLLQFPIQIRSRDDHPLSNSGPDSLIEKIIHALGLTRAVYKIDFVRNQNEQWLVRHIETLTMSDWLPLEWWQTELGHSIISSILQCIANRPMEIIPSNQQCVVQWFETHSGNVLSVTGEEDACAVAGVTHVDVTVAPGDVMRHVVDRESRDKVGFVIAEGKTALEANEASKNAVRKIYIETENVLETPFDA